jgi:hypothetical protein
MEEYEQDEPMGLCHPDDLRDMLIVWQKDNKLFNEIELDKIVRYYKNIATKIDGCYPISYELYIELQNICFQEIFIDLAVNGYFDIYWNDDTQDLSFKLTKKGQAAADKLQDKGMGGLGGLGGPGFSSQ